MRKIIGAFFIITAIVIFCYVIYTYSGYSKANRTFSSYSLLTSTWEKYKTKFIAQDGRVLDLGQNSITTSEGQSYAMLRAVWMDDKETFDRVWKFTKDNMKRQNDNLYGWKWGQRKNGTYGFLEDGGENSASDADSDIALALIFASNRWSKREYLDAAKVILKDLWTINTAVVQNKRYLIAGNWANGDEVILNPSYFAPYAWRIFAIVDTDRDWKSLIDPAYEILTRVTVAPLDTGVSARLPPDWVALDPKTGEVKASKISSLSTKYSYDALRVPWRIGLDYQWNREQKAYDYLRHLSFLSEQYSANNGALFNVYSHSGEPIERHESPSMYAGALGYFIVHRPEIAKKIYDEKIIRLYSNDDNTFKEDIPYYEQNWLWFGAALYNNSLVAYVR